MSASPSSISALFMASQLVEGREWQVESSAVVSAARRLAHQRGHRLVEPEHLLFALLESGACPSRGLPQEAVLRRAEARLQVLPRIEADRVVPQLSVASSRVLQLAQHPPVPGDEGEQVRLLEALLEVSPTCRQVMSTGRSTTAAESLGMTSSASRTTARSTRPDDALDRYGRDLTALAAGGLLDPLVGRDQELTRVIRVLCRRTKNNPVLLGDAGVGKTAIVEGLAQRVAAGDVPSRLRGARVVALDLGALVAGTKLRGEFEQRLTEVLDAIVESPSPVIAFVDELHMLTGAGAAEGALDAANLVKPLLARGECMLIGATTFDEYRTHVEADPALERRFQPVHVSEPDVAHTIAILRGLRAAFEAHHEIVVSDEALVAAAHLSDRYLSGRRQPDKAIDLLDEAGSLLRSELDHQYDEAPVEADQDDTHAVLDEEHIARVASEWTGIPLVRIEKGEAERLARLESDLSRRVVGQGEAVSRVATVVRRGRSGVAAEDRPVGSMLFVGPPGVGKTELARALAETLFGDERALVRIDMTEYAQPHDASRLLGAPPGYVGYERGGQLTEAVRRRPYSVVLFDEVDKAHAVVVDALLPLLEDGRLTDGLGRTVDFRNAIVVLTSNAIGAGRPQPGEADGPLTAPATPAQAGLRPELIDRLDDVISFRPLGQVEVEQIVSLQLGPLRARLAERSLSLTLTTPALRRLAMTAISRGAGGRPVRRLVQREIVDEAATLLLSGEVQPGDDLLVAVIADRVELLRRASPPSA